MSVLVLGDGLLGKEIINQTNWQYISRKKNGFDVTKSYNLNILDEYDIIVNCIAYTKTYNVNRNDNWEINYRFVDKLIDYCNANSKKLIHISTDYIYTGSIENATEEDVPVHLNTWYGYTKLIGDSLVQLRCNNYLICRLSHKPYPFPYKEAWCDIKTNCDYVTTIASMVIKLINNECNGVYNIGTEPKSLYDLAIITKKDVISINKPSYVPDNTTMNLDKINEIYK